jgi:hypothetical protein
MTLNCHIMCWIIHALEEARPGSCRRRGFPAVRFGAFSVPVRCRLLGGNCEIMLVKRCAFSISSSVSRSRSRGTGVAFPTAVPHNSWYPQKRRTCANPRKPLGRREYAETAWRLALALVLSTTASLAVLPDLFRPYRVWQGFCSLLVDLAQIRRFSWASLR